jgi:predicted acylesterase/phospholipase RssA
MPTTVLSIDGGGIRGIIPAMVLAELERLTGRRTAGLFDLIAGTSTGGILACALTKPGEDGAPQWRAADLVGLYEKEGPRIFSRSVFHRIRSVEGLADEKYPSGPIDEVMREYLGDACLKDALTRVLITSYEVERRMPFFFKSWRAQQDSYYDFSMCHVARATSAAPTYFEVERVPPDWSLIDGGVFANNPAMCAYAEAVRLGLGPDIRVVSLGTGELTRRLPYDDVKDWGVVEWVRPLIDVIFDGVSDTVDYQLRHLLDKDRYMRVQTMLTEASDDLDDATEENLRLLRLQAERLVQETDFDDLLALLG